MEEILAKWISFTVRLMPVVPAAGLLLASLFGCQAKRVAPPAPPPPQAIDFTQPLPEGQVALRKVSPSDYPDFSKALARLNPADLRRAVANSLSYLSRPSSAKRYPYLDIDHDRAVASLKAFDALLESNALSMPPEQFNQIIANQFEVYQSIGAPRPDGGGYTGKVLFTGYFTPTYDASLTRGGAYQWPIYKRPADLVSDESGDTANRKLADGTLAPYPPRQEIESGLLAGQELAWVTTRWNAYVITVQGSARLRLPDGRIMEVGYAGNNGRPYASPGMQMVADGVLARPELSFEAMRRYFDAHPDAMDKYLWLNQRTVFFTDRPGGPFGSLNVPVTRFATIATDKAVYPPAMVAFLSVPIPAAALEKLPGSGTPLASASSAGTAYDGFLLDQDRGGAIRSAGRCDIYMGIGQSAEQMSGHQLDAGSLYYLAVKPQLVAKYLRGDGAAEAAAQTAP
jgi:membrane-bound lytic murein transglycosylase A